jgi:AraC family L-rhamnose operon transcriptional activator RhaR
MKNVPRRGHPRATMIRQLNFFDLADMRLAAIAEPHSMPTPVLPHEHPYTELVVVLEGQADHTSPQGIRTVKRGDVLVIREGAWHGYKNLSDFVIYNCYVSGEIFNHALEGFEGLAHHPSFRRLIAPSALPLQHSKIMEGHLPEKSVLACHEHLDVIYQLTKPHSVTGRLHRTYQPAYPLVKRPANDPTLAIKLMAHLLLFFDEIIVHNALEDELSGSEVSLHPAVQGTLAMLAARPAHAWTLDEIAAALHIDPSYLGRLFKKAMGMPPLAYLSRYRADLAAKLLVVTDRPVSDIGLEVGWPDPGYFAERFKAHFGLSPRSYRSRFLHGTPEDV